MQKKTFNMKVIEHTPTGWLVATSEDLPELLAQGKDLHQFRERAPNVIRRILERKGTVVEEVRIEPRPRKNIHLMTRKLVAVSFVLEAA